MSEPKQRAVESKTWFDRMGASLSWRVIPPAINAPFSTPLPTNTLLILLHYPTKLRSTFQIKCMCDGFEVLHLRNLEAPIYCTDNPCVAQMSVEEILDYLNRSEVMELVNQAIEVLRDEIIDELARREREKEANQHHGLVPVKRRKETKGPPPNPGRFSFRVIRRRG